ncbi:hypothetical protein TNCV_2840291 [Trichonephila clavipes]|uniref:Uncharacterized protein n=1 Tax=Trichonephila clavipes TaxID=2585209 RepID=A0A8X6V900_TRICX|nr:hypothetical protein TNCV_2840291 [Trichonephila clavipes]
MEKGAIASRRLDFYLLVHGRYFISLLPPIGNQWRRSPIRHLGTLLKMGMVPLRDSLRELLYSPDAPRIAEAVIKTFDGI